MLDTSDSTKIAMREDGQNPTPAYSSSVVDSSTGEVDVDSTTASTVLAEILPGVAVEFGEVPAGLKLDLIDFGLVSAADREQTSTVLASIGNTATVTGSLGNAFASAQGLYRIGGATQALLKAGGRLAVKDGANLGAVMSSGRIVGQARWVPVSAVGTAQLAATLGPALTMIALQMQLSEITSLARTNIALTSQVLTTIRHEQWAELTSLVASIDRTIDRAREIGSVSTPTPCSLPSKPGPDIRRCTPHGPEPLDPKTLPRRASSTSSRVTPARRSTPLCPRRPTSSTR
jgi:hypothetical protein